MFWRQTLTAAAFAGLAAAQVTTDCNPMEKDCPDNPALSTSHFWDLVSRPDRDLWEVTVGPVEFEEENGAHFQINKQGDSPTIRSKFYIFGGRVSFLMKASPGKGIISSAMLLSDNLDEIDWEFIGTEEQGTTNFYGKGIEDHNFGEYHDMSGTPHDEFHNYTTIWTEDALEWWINDKKVRTVKAGEPKSNGTDIYPQTPMRVYFGIWAGGDPRLEEGTREWAGGDTEYDKGPFDMFVKDVHIEDYSTGEKYVWGDRSGTWDSIEIVEGESKANKTIHKEPEKSLNEKFNDLPEAGKIAIYASGAGVAAVIVAAIIFYCIKQRRRGAEEARSALQASETDRMELNRFEKNGIDPDGFTEHGAEYNARDMKDNGMVRADSYAVPAESPGMESEKAWPNAAATAGAAAGFGGAAAAAASMRSHTSSPAQYQDLRTAQHPGIGGYTSPPPPSPGMHRSPGSPGPSQSYGAHRMQSQSPALGYSSSGARSFSDNPQSYGGYGMDRMQSPGPPMSPRSFSANQGFGSDRMSPGPNGHRY